MQSVGHTVCRKNHVGGLSRSSVSVVRLGPCLVCLLLSASVVQICSVAQNLAFDKFSCRGLADCHDPVCLLSGFPTSQVGALLLRVCKVVFQNQMYNPHPLRSIIQLNLIPYHQHSSPPRTIAKFSKESERFKRQSVLVKDSLMHRCCPGELV